jgi:predicted DCC family thiol-disulfide oxidoreductase YuxK
VDSEFLNGSYLRPERDGTLLPFPHMDSLLRQGPILLYDGLCGFCNGTVQFVLRHDHRGLLRFAPLQSELARRLMARHPELASVDSLILLDADPASGAERVFVRSNGSLQVARYLGGPWRLALVFRLIPRALRDWAYDLFARWRYRLFGRYASCPLPTPEQRARFLVGE